MGHRHLFGTSQMFESGHDQNWNHLHTEQPYANLGTETFNIFNCTLNQWEFGTVFGFADVKV